MLDKHEACADGLIENGYHDISLVTEGISPFGLPWFQANREAIQFKVRTEDDVLAACAWSDFRKEYGVSADDETRKAEHRAFLAGWGAGKGTLDIGGVQRCPRRPQIGRAACRERVCKYVESAGVDG